MDSNPINNWDFHYGSTIRRIGILLGLNGHVVLNGEIARFICETTQQFGSCIEIGAGSGRLSMQLSRHFEFSYILDCSRKALDVSRKMSLKSLFIHSDIFEFRPSQTFDAVVSVGLVEHFIKNDMERLVQIHIDLAEENGGVYIVVPSYSKERAELVKKPSMVKNYGYNDVRAEFLIDAYLSFSGYSYEKYRMDKIPRTGLFNKLLRYTGIILYKIFKINLDHHISCEWGNYIMFYIKKSEKLIDRCCKP